MQITSVLHLKFGVVELEENWRKQIPLQFFVQNQIDFGAKIELVSLPLRKIGEILRKNNENEWMTSSAVRTSVNITLYRGSMSMNTTTARQNVI